MYKKIMIPTDGSGFDRTAILVALRIAERCDAKAFLVRVVTAGAYLGAQSLTDGMDPENALRAEQRAGRSELDALAAECRRTSKAEIRVDLEEGPAADVLERYAKRNEIDLIVISSHGRRGLARLSLGSVTDSLIRATTVPVLVVKPNASYLTPIVSQEFHSLVVPLDGSALAERILAHIVPLAKLEGKEITLVHILAPLEDGNGKGDTRTLPWWNKKVASARAYLTRRASEMRLQGVTVKIEVLTGTKVAEAITDYARSEGADLIAIATHGRGGLARVVRGSVADAVIKSATCSLLVLHPEKAVENELAEESGEESREEAATLV
jgi:nucleotide-binding universal stress UspA family protein